MTMKPGRKMAGRQGFHMIYVITTLDDRPCKLGIADNAQDRLSNIQTSNWVELRMHKCWYMAGRIITTRCEYPIDVVRDIEDAVSERLSSQRLRGEWYDVDAKTMAAAVLAEAEAINAWVMTPSELEEKINAAWPDVTPAP